MPTAQMETIIVTDLSRPLEMVHLGNALFTNDAMANKIVVDVYNKMSPYALSGTIQASIIHSDGTTTTFTGGIQNTSQAYIVLPQEAYSIAGPIRILVRNVNGNQKTPLAAMSAYIQEG